MFILYHGKKALATLEALHDLRKYNRSKSIYCMVSAGNIVWIVTKPLIMFTFYFKKPLRAFWKLFVLKLF